MYRGDAPPARSPVQPPPGAALERASTWHSQFAAQQQLAAAASPFRGPPPQHVQGQQQLQRAASWPHPPLPVVHHTGHVPAGGAAVAASRQPHPSPFRSPLGAANGAPAAAGGSVGSAGSSSCPPSPYPPLPGSGPPSAGPSPLFSGGSSRAPPHLIPRAQPLAYEPDELQRSFSSDAVLQKLVVAETLTRAGSWQPPQPPPPQQQQQQQQQQQPCCPQPGAASMGGAAVTGTGAGHGLMPPPKLQRASTFCWHKTGVKLSELVDATTIKYEYKYTVTGRVRKKGGERPGRKVVVNGETVALFRYGQQLFAVSAKCAHQGGPLDMGDIEELGEHGPCVECPWHRWSFNLSTGQSVAPEGHSIPTYPVRLEDDASISVGMEGMAKTLFSNDDF